MTVPVQGGEAASRQAHNLENARSNRAPATNPPAVPWPRCPACGRGLTYRPNVIGTSPHYSCPCGLSYDASLTHTFEVAQ